MQIRMLQAADGARWDRFVEAHPDATMFHLSGWREVLGGALGHPTWFLYAERDGAIAGVLPLAHVKSLLFGNTLSSLPFCTVAGALAQDESIACALEDEALALARRLGVGALELRNARPSGRARPVKALYENFTKAVLPTEDENMKAVRSKQRNVVRKGIKSGLTHRVDTLDAFYPVYAESVRNLGTPVFPRRLFSAIEAAFPGRTEYFSACDAAGPVSSAMLFWFRDTVCPYYWGGTERARGVAGNDYLCWQILCRAAARGVGTFDFGRSKIGTGAHQWKVNWGFEPHPLAYEYELVRDRVMPDVNPLNPKYRLFIETWKRLPLPLTMLIGPWLSRSLG